MSEAHAPTTDVRTTPAMGTWFAAEEGDVYSGLSREKKSPNLITMQGEVRMHLESGSYYHARGSGDALEQSSHKDAINLFNYFSLVQKPSSHSASLGSGSGMLQARQGE